MSPMRSKSNPRPNPTMCINAFSAVGESSSATNTRFTIIKTPPVQSHETCAKAGCNQYVLSGLERRDPTRLLRFQSGALLRKQFRLYGGDGRCGENKWQNVLAKGELRCGIVVPEACACRIRDG